MSYMVVISMVQEKGLLNYHYKVAAKTGTAQAFYSGPVQSANMRAVWNLTFVGYAPA